MFFPGFCRSQAMLNIQTNITLHYKLFIVAKVKNCKVHYGEVTQQCQDMTAEISVFSFRRNDNSDVAVVTSRGRVIIFSFVVFLFVPVLFVCATILCGE